jgi:hypothetical protein
MSNIDHDAHPGGSRDDEPPRRCLRRRLTRLRSALQNRLWSADEKWAAERGLTARRSPAGWAIRITDPRFGLRHQRPDPDDQEGEWS